MTRYLMVPVQLDALYVAGEELSVVKQSPDFPAQPYAAPEQKQEFNADTANLSEALVNPPFQTKTMSLSHGLHLHWAMPDSLTRGDSGLNFPNVPDRWLVTRRRLDSQSQQWQEEKQWVVESNYLFPPHINKKGLSVSIPHSSREWELDPETQTYRYAPGHYTYHVNQIPVAIAQRSELMSFLFSPQANQTLLLQVGADKLQSWLASLSAEHGVSQDDITALIAALQQPLGRSQQPYRYMGRRLPAAAYQSHNPSAEYYANLSAVGYGDPGFAAYYPSCFSVFGFHDPNPGDDINGLRYDVAGWYAEPAGDPLKAYIASLSDQSDSTVKRAVKEKFNWQVKGEVAPQQLLCCGHIGFDKFNAEYQTEHPSDISVTVANTPTEALSAKLADQLVKDKPELPLAEQKRYLQTLEDQFEAMQMAYRLDSKQLDTLSRFKELRHENGFTPIDSGHLWIIRKHSPSNQQPDQQQSEHPLADLPTETAELLDKLNLLQKAYNASARDVSALRRQLFADWYKYMICVYPPDLAMSDYPSADLVKFFLEQKSMQPLEDLIHKTGQLGEVQTTTQGFVQSIEISPDSADDSCAAAVRQQLNQLLSALNTLNQGNSDENGGVFCVEQIPASRFWQPNNPVVLLAGDGVKPGVRHGADGTLRCAVFEKSTSDTIGNTRDFADLSRALAPLFNPQLHIQSEQPWNPYVLQWQTQLFNAQTKSNLHENQGYYSSSFITQNYHAESRNPDLSLKKGQGRLVQSGDSYSGSSILTPQANQLLKTAIEQQLVERLSVFQQAEDISLDQYEGERDYTNPVYSMICAYEKLKETQCLAQSLNGFNQGLLMRKQTLELHVEDPLGFGPYQGFSNQRISRLIGDDIKEAPSPMSAFNPIRTGCIKFINLRLLDTFGQARKIGVDAIDTTCKLTLPSSRYLINLPPRLAEPARLNFRWLDSDSNTREVNSHPDTSPICGWLLSNQSDRSVMLYDHNGKALGYFKAGRWHQAIDSDTAISVAQISNPHLRRVAKYIEYSLTLDPEFIRHFIGTTDDALSNIQSESDHSASGPASLIGRPMAVVRASVSLELAARAAVNQSWNILRGDMGKNRRTSDSYTRVKFPVRLGEYNQLNDGLIGYWLEGMADNGNISFISEGLDSTGQEALGSVPMFYSPQSQYIDSATIDSRFNQLQSGPINFYQSLDDPAQTVTMLMDVKGSVHATAGILPNREITIPPEHYAEALQNIEVSFLHAPILTPSHQTRLPVRPIKGFEWTWVERTKGADQQLGWDEKFVEKRIPKEAFLTQLSQLCQQQALSVDGESLWQYLLSENVGWLAHTDDDRDGHTDAQQARLVAADLRKLNGDSPFSPPFNGLEKITEKTLQLSGVGLDSTIVDAEFASEQQIREGWLKLRRRLNN